MGVAIPKNGQTQTISALTVDANVTVAGLLQDKSLKAADETLTEQARYAAAASGENSIWRSIGVGGVVGTMDAANLTLETDPNKNNMTNKAAVIGSAFTGGVVGNLYNSGSADVPLTGLQNEGTVSVGANYLGSAEDENSRVLGQFFGGIAGYCKNVTLSGSTSTTRRDMTETQLKTAVKGMLTMAHSPMTARSRVILSAVWWALPAGVSWKIAPRKRVMCWAAALSAAWRAASAAASLK